jgi:hypothetical protein
VSISGFCAPDELELELLLLDDELLDELDELLELELEDELELEEELDEPVELLPPLSPPPQPVKRRESNEIAKPKVRRGRSMIHKQREAIRTSAIPQQIQAPDLRLR